MRRTLLAAAFAAATAAPLLTTSPAQAAETFSGSLSQAIGAVSVASEVRTGYDRDLFRHWIDADGDGCDTRREVLLEEAEEAPTRGSGCSLTGGRWYSYYDGVSQYDAADLQIDHMVPLAEAWDSGARSWSAAQREDFANDLGDPRPLIAVTGAENSSKSDRDPAEWLPDRQHCRYAEEWVATKIRWGLSQDSAERSALQQVASGCTGTTVTVEVVG
ncbi:HNH endonuclease family protein [Nocardioides aequoreus]|uniref:HNH endonuclease family protein n=1 Tax=Nocardioides aequoreus TaxID=397278 RepID=UPI0004C377F4|nr:HNH endonuclease family protein [Nocardioides aequoreus]